MGKFSLLNNVERLLLDNIEELKKLIYKVELLFQNFPEVFEEAISLAQEVKNCILEIDPLF